MISLRRIVLSAMILVAALSTCLAQKVTETVLPNGLKVVIKEVHSAPVFASEVWYKVGSRNEHTGITGISHLVEHMMFKGTPKYPSSQFSKLIAAKGGQENAATATDYTFYYELLSSDNLELALKLESDRMTNAIMDAKEFKSERVVVLSELEGRANDPDSLLYENLQAVSYQEHPYRWPTIGYVDNLEHITRDQLYSYYKTYYHPNNATLVVVGDVDTASTLKMVKKYFGGIAKGPVPPGVYTQEPPQIGERRFTIRKEGTADRVMIAYHIPQINNPDSYPLMVLDQVLSGGKSGRMYQAIVEKAQLATSAWSNTSLTKDPGLFMVGGTCRDNVTAAQLEPALLEQVEKAKTTAPTKAEMEQAINQLETYLIMQKDSVSNQAEQIGYYETVASDWKYSDTLLSKIKAVTPEDVLRVANKYLTVNNRTVGWFVPTGPAVGGTGAPSGAAPLHYKYPFGVYFHKPPTSNKTVASKPTKSDVAKSTSIVKPKRYVLNNGMVVIVQENHSNPTVAIEGNLKAGGYFDPAGKKGLASFVAGMLDRGTTTRNALEIAKITDFVGADVSTGAGTESSYYSAEGLSRDFNLLLDVLSDELMNPAFPQDQIDKLKGQTISQLQQESEAPDQVAYRDFRRQIFPAGNPYRPNTIDDQVNIVNSYTRDDMVNFHKQYFGPQTAVIVIVGDVNAEDAKNAVEKYFGQWTQPVPPTKMVFADTPLASKPSTDVVDMPDKTQTNVMIGNAGGLKRTDPDYYACQVMNHVLGGGAGLESRLGTRIRQQLGLVYYIYSGFNASMGDGPWFLSFGSNPGNVDKAMVESKKVVEKYIKEGPTKKEFNDAIDYIVGSQPIRLETNDGVADTLLSAEFFGLGMDFIQNNAKYYRAVTMDQVRAAAKKHLHPEVFTTVIAGPYKAK